MEAASFVIFDHANFKFQLEDHTAYFVHHMSYFEHAIHKKEGFAIAENKTLIMSNAAIKVSDQCFPCLFRFFSYLSLSIYYTSIDKSILQNDLNISPSQGECGTLTPNSDPRFMAFIPFFGGRPPGVQGSADNPNLKVHSIGQGNSLIKAEVKALQTLATICSVLKYFGQATVGKCFFLLSFEPAY